MTKVLGNPNQPCNGIERSKRLLETISEGERENAQNGRAAAEEVEAGIVGIRAMAVEILGGTCSVLCPKYGRCILDSFGNGDPLLRKASLNPDEERELGAKQFLDQLYVMAKEAIGIM